jgi:hypothetical protein
MSNPAEKVSKPTSDQCDATAALAADGASSHRFAMWHPQLGGYVGRCIVEFGDTSGACEGGQGCFDVLNWHDGEFPTDDSYAPDEKHYCDAMQLIEFGLSILELQAKHQKAMAGGPVTIDRDDLVDLQARIAKLVSP